MKDLDARPPASLSKQAAMLTLGVWGLDTLLFCLPSVAAGKPPTVGLTCSYALTVLLGLGMSVLVYRRAVRLPREGGAIHFTALVPTVLAAALTMAVFDLIVGGFVRTLIDATHPVARAIGARAVSQFMMDAWMLALLGALYLMMVALRVTSERERQLADARAQALAAEGQATAARLAALRYQLNPHFLFNTLNAVSSAVITGRKDEAEAMLARLADFLRQTLSADPQAQIPLEDEMATLQSYLEIESVRFRDRLGVEFECPDDLREALVPSFLLQPLVENAVKHGVAQTSRPVTIRLEAARDGEDLVVTVEDDGEAAVHSAAGHSTTNLGLGLTNIRQRLEVLFGERGVLQAGAKDRGFRVEVRMPLRLAVAKARAA